MAEAPLYVVAGLLGLAAGSFLNVVIARLPRQMSIVHPRSHCPVCSSRILWNDLIPIWSYLHLRGACRRCKVRIPVRYPLIELAAAVIFLFLFYQHGASTTFLRQALLMMTLIAAAEIDRLHGIVPNRLLLGSFIAGLPLVLSNDLASIRQCLLAASAAGVIMVGLRGLGQLFFSRPGMGMGDVKLAAVAGFYLGWPVFLGLYLAIIAAGMLSIAGLVSGHLKTGARCPFAPFIALGVLSMLPFPNLFYLFP